MLTDGRTDGRKIGRLYPTLLQAGAIKKTNNKICCETVIVALALQVITKSHILQQQSSDNLQVNGYMSGRDNADQKEYDFLLKGGYS